MAITESDIQARLRTLIDPNTGRDFVSGKQLRKVTISGHDVAVDIQLGYPAKSQIDMLRRMVAESLATVPGIGRLDNSITQRISSHAVQRGVKLIPGVKNIVAIAS